MNKSSILNFKFLSNIYLKIKINNLNYINHKISEIKKELEKEKKSQSHNLSVLDSSIAKNNLTKLELLSLNNLFEKQNKTFAIKNNNYDIDVWQNLLIEKHSLCYALETKKGESIFFFDENMNSFLEYLSQLKYSIIVLSLDSSKIILQIRLH